MVVKRHRLLFKRLISQIEVRLFISFFAGVFLVKYIILGKTFSKIDFSQLWMIFKKSKAKKRKINFKKSRLCLDKNCSFFSIHINLNENFVLAKGTFSHKIIPYEIMCFYMKQQKVSQIFQQFIIVTIDTHFCRDSFLN